MDTPLTLDARASIQPAISRTFVWALTLVQTAGNILILLGGSWDGAYHARYQVDTFWSPPHLLIYGGMLTTLLLGIFLVGWFLLTARQHANARALITDQPLIVLPLLANIAFLATAPFDELWHSLFGRDQLTTWTVPHSILVLNLALTAFAIVGLAIWLHSPTPSGGLRPSKNVQSNRAANILMFLGASLFLNHLRAFVTEWEVGVPIPGPVLAQGWLYPLLLTFILALGFAFAVTLLTPRWWLPLALVLVAQFWYIAPALFLTLFGYVLSEHLRLAPILAGAWYGALLQFFPRLRAWQRDAAFGIGCLFCISITYAFGGLPTLTWFEILLSAPLLPFVGIVGGRVGVALARWLEHLASERVVA